MQYTPFISDIELPFYSSLASLKVDHDKLDDSARKVLGLYEIKPSDRPEESCRMQILGNALLKDDVPAGYYRAEGMIKNVNTMEEYRNADKPAILQLAGKTIWEAINDGTIYSCPSLLASFTVLSFADLKKYKFSYWFAFPAIHSSPPWAPAASSINKEEVDSTGQKPSSNASRQLTGPETVNLVDAVQTWRYGVDARQHGFFLAKKVWTNPDEKPLKGPYEWQISPLSGYEEGFFNNSKEEDCYVCFADPSNYDDAPSWVLRNLLVLVQKRWKLNKVQIMRYRDLHSRRDQGRTLIMTLETDNSQTSTNTEGSDAQSMLPKITGWERNSAGKLAGRIVDLKEYMDPQRLADQSVDLNLKLMKWRISPNLNLDDIKKTKCLLLGAGTLGSYVARNLLGWGVNKVTFVDNGSVSFSNPVRQPLFNFNDCLGGGAKKALRAAEALKEIYPGVDSTGHVLSVPMAGHPVVDEDKAKAEFELLKKLVEEHDAIFLLMDTRESRWLPTLLGKAAGKIVLNAALGFDTFVVMRHGSLATAGSANGLGCYFCNDVVAPGNSTKAQTLDQQCTVTRPGIAAIASALLVELFVSIVQHPQGADAPATTSLDEDSTENPHPLGIVPHQIRGYLSRFNNVIVTGKDYSCCSACSGRIIDLYMQDGWDFVKRAMNEKSYIEEVSGLKEVQRLADAVAEGMGFSDSDDADDDELVEI
ncbi:E1-like protein-activating enzyme Gsa7p/Apg7p [Nannizzia gypsea CBS 118893]|uniref:Ubiquitin-like modifier-activating enzyme ATG7 n=1 Tax=Arthroderma gypseum (strain ATCC MYA-4604 / CBS 118893) TaxID=535722 RepID=E5QYP6_ARTGP|nr:E1-like protein-activating enzyme Gsa7p/Apg7p [Nannizzia gypsea CBS 118893]EFQ98909.1 E1-like protein-activating enzyme Gsa7p/Apg7p [Nannizzia gypsea CBS 118893]